MTEASKPDTPTRVGLSEELGISVSSDHLTYVLASTDQNGEIARINADGTTFYDWPRISALAAQWRPYCGDFGINLARLLAPLRDAVAPAQGEQPAAMGRP